MPLYDASSMEIQRTQIHGIVSADTFFEDYLQAHHPRTASALPIKETPKEEKKSD